MPALAPEPVAPVPVPVVSQLGALAFDALPGYMRRSDDGTLAGLMAAIGVPVEALASLLQNWRAWTDPEVVAFDRMGWLAAFTGLDLTGVAAADRRSAVSNPVLRAHGTEAAIRARVALTLTGARQVMITCPYQGDPDHVYVRTLADETPNPAATLLAIRAEVPAWKRLTAEVAAAGGLTYNALGAKYATYDAMTATGKTNAQLAQETT